LPSNIFLKTSDIRYSERLDNAKVCFLETVAELWDLTIDSKFEEQGRCCPTEVMVG